MLHNFQLYYCLPHFIHATCFDDIKIIGINYIDRLWKKTVQKIYAKLVNLDTIFFLA